MLQVALRYCSKIAFFTQEINTSHGIDSKVVSIENKGKIKYTSTWQLKVISRNWKIMYYFNDPMLKCAIQIKDIQKM